MNLTSSITVTVEGSRTGICGDNLTWELTNGELHISGTGRMYDYNDLWDTPWIELQGVSQRLSLMKALKASAATRSQALQI
ncbi:MAG: hypothetical protein IKP40_07485 [Clostridia bacterium]|nr:hypothetical protein [Clostridia bacterium]